MLDLRSRGLHILASQASLRCVLEEETYPLLSARSTQEDLDVIEKWASSRENLSSGFPTKRVSNQSPQLQRLARKLKFHL